MISVIKIDENMTIYGGGGCNSVVLRSQDGQRAIIVDTKYFGGAKELKRLVIAPNVTVINTHFHLDHTRGNKYYPDALVISGETNWKQWDFDTAHSKRPDIILKSGEIKRLQMDDEVIDVIDFGNAHSPNDLVVFFNKRKVLAAGDLVWIDTHPVLLDKNTNLGQWKIYLRRILDEFDANKVVPGHGKICGKDAVINMLEYFDSISGSLNDPEKLNGVKNKYKRYKTFPIFGNFARTVKLLKRSA